MHTCDKRTCRRALIIITYTTIAGARRSFLYAHLTYRPILATRNHVICLPPFYRAQTMKEFKAYTLTSLSFVADHGQQIIVHTRSFFGSEEML